MGLAILATRSYVTTQKDDCTCAEGMKQLQILQIIALHHVSQQLAEIFNTSIFLQNFKTLH